MLEQFTVENFKGFEQLTLDDLGHINIFVGKNNTGKTSLLQLGYFAATTLDPVQLKPLNLDVVKLRWQMGKYPFQMFKQPLNLLFNNLDIQKTIKLRAVFNDENIEGADYTISYEKDPFGSEDSLKIQNPEGKGYNLYADVPDPPLEIHPFRPMDLPYLSTTTNWEYLIKEGFSKIVDNERESELISLLSIIEPKLKDIRSNGYEIYFDLGNTSKKRMPLVSQGDGFRKLMALAIIIKQMDRSDDLPFIFIDEPENGFHYSVQSQFWQLLATAGLEHGKQSFIATHSYELLESLNTLLVQNPDLTKPKEEDGQELKVRVYELERINEQIQVTKITSDIMSILIKNKSDFRG
jgi:AAA15 family ATPase/GTPase